MVEQRLERMAVCLPPDSSAVVVALAHVRELETHLKETLFLSSPEASVHLEAISAAVTELEAARCAADRQVRLQVTENDKLRRHAVDVRERTCRRVMTEVRAVRRCHAEEIEALGKHLDSISKRREEVVNLQEDILSQNDALQMQAAEMKEERIRLTAALKDQNATKRNLEKSLDRSLKQAEKLKRCSAAAAEDMARLQSRFQMEKENFSSERDALSAAARLTEEKVLQQKQVVLTKGKVLDGVHQKKLDSINHLGDFMVHVARLKSDMHEKAVALCQREEQLRAEIQKRKQLRQESDRLRRESSRMEDGYKASLRDGRAELEELEGLMEGDLGSKMPLQDSADRMSEALQVQLENERKIKEEHQLVKQQLERSELNLEVCLASDHGHKQEASDLDGKIRDLHEAADVFEETLEDHLKELRERIDEENQNIDHLEKEKRDLCQLLEKVQVEQERQVTTISSETSQMMRRHRELQREELEFLHLHPDYDHPDQLLSHMTACEREYKRLDHLHTQEIMKCNTETQTISQNICQRLQLLEEEEKTMMEIEAKNTKLRSRLHGLQRLSSEMKSRGHHLETSIQKLKENTSLLLRNQKQGRAELEKARAEHTLRLQQQAADLNRVEVAIFNQEAKLEQVRRQNGLIRLQNRKMTKEVRRSTQSVDFYKTQRQLLTVHTQKVVERLHTAWRKDQLLMERSRSRHCVLLTVLEDTLNRLKAGGDLLWQVTYQPVTEFRERTRAEFGATLG